ncbi:hypothetical protein ID866_12323 [Astraeus odoratus]|nr:hypothetical protein ID866_12323 [Astraeus odoratus]
MTKIRSSSHIKSKSMGEIPFEDTQHDIQLYISSELEVSGDDLSGEDIGCLAGMSDGLFEWARLACAYIKSPKGADTLAERYGDLLSVTGRSCEGLLDKMYHTILEDALEDKPRTRSRFRSVMRQILAMKEPLCMDSLAAMRLKFPREEDRYDVKLVLRLMGALLSGIHPEVDILLLMLRIFIWILAVHLSV